LQWQERGADESGAMMMIHNPDTIAIGNTAEIEKGNRDA